MHSRLIVLLLCLKVKIIIIFLSGVFFFGCNHKNTAKSPDIYCIPVLVGEVTQNSAVFQARLTASDTLVFDDIHDPENLANADVEGKEGIARFEIADDASFADPIRTVWLLATPDRDFIVKKEVNNLQANKRYYYRLEYGIDSLNTKRSDINTFNTFPSEDTEAPVDFIMLACLHLERFYFGGGFGKASAQGKEAYKGEDKHLGFHGFETIAQMEPDFLIANGDNVYYDHPPDYKATTQAELRAKWHRLFAMPRNRVMLSRIPTFWMKDDHDHRFDDSDTVAVNERHGAKPSNELGIRTFLEQVPVADPDDESAVTFRTVRINKLLQIWMVEGRDYRSPNAMPPGPEKSIWGEEQKAWLKQTLLESDAIFKILVSPTPMVGPDDLRKRDNHTNPYGFRVEGEEFFQWLKENDFLNKNFYIICGDRHWKYHSVHPIGFEEFSCGALVEQNSRLGKLPGDEDSTDPAGKIIQPYTDAGPSGGFLKVSVLPASDVAHDKHTIVFLLYDQHGKELYKEEKICKNC